MKPALLFLSLALLLGHNSQEICAQNISRYIILHRNRKNESVVKPSPLAFGYSKTTAIEFVYEPEPTEAMKKRVERIFGSQAEESKKEEEEIKQEAYEILGNNSMLFSEETNTLLQEIQEETEIAINVQKQQALAKLELQRKQNIASYTASVEAKIRRAKEALLKPPEEEEEEPVWSEFSEPYWGTDLEEEAEDENSVILVTDSSGKISRVTPRKKDTTATASTTASTTAPIP